MNPPDETTVDIKLDCINADSARFILILLQKITYVRLLNKNFIINWYYKPDDQDVLETGRDIALTLNVPFNFIMIN